MAGFTTLKRAGAALAGSALLATTLTACFSEPTALPAVRNFLVHWQERDYDAAARLTTGDRRQVAAALRAVPSQLDAASVTLALRGIQPHGNTADARFRVQVDLGENGVPWEYAGLLRLKRNNGDWTVQWGPSVIHPGLRDGQRLALVTESPPRADIEYTNGLSLLKRTKATAFGVYPASLRKTDQLVREVAAATNIDYDRLSGLVRSARPQEFLPLVTVPGNDTSGLAAKLHRIAELRTQELEMPVRSAVTPDLIGAVGPGTAEALQQVGSPYQPGEMVGTSGLQLRQQRRLAGTPTIKVVAQDATGGYKNVLHSWPGNPSARIRTTINRNVQLAAQHALRKLKVPAGLVAMHAKTGEILAAHNHRSGGRDIALEGQYPPGMAFSILSAEALVTRGQPLAAPAPCLSSQTVGGTIFRNAPDVPDNKKAKLIDGFAQSCSTAFAGLAGVVSDQDLRATAGRFGLGQSWDMPVSAFSGTVPLTRSEGERAAAMVGQGGVRMSPLSMAVIAGAVDSGTWRPPLLVIHPRQRPAAQAQPLEPEMFRALQALMRRSVTHGKARTANLPGTATYGVTATVNDPDTKKTISWFAGFRGPYAFALAVEGNAPAARLARRFLRDLYTRGA